MSSQYPVLRYPGNVTSSDQAQPGAMLGWDEMGRPYEVLDAEFIEGPVSVDSDGSGYCDQPGYTNVYLQYATAETIRAALTEAGASAGTLDAASRMFS